MKMWKQLFAFLGMISLSLIISIRPSEAEDHNYWTSLPLEELWKRDGATHWGKTDFYFIASISDMEVLNNGQIMLVGAGKYGKWLTRFSSEGKLVSEMWNPKVSGSIYRLASASNGSVFVAGNVKSMHFLDLIIMSPNGRDLFVAYLDSNNREVWHRQMGGFDFQTAINISRPMNGKIAVVGRDKQQNWILVFNEKGGELWDRKIGIGRAAAVATNKKNSYLVVAFETVEQNDFLNKNVVAWIFDQNGSVQSKLVLRNLISTDRGRYESVHATAIKDEFYISSAQRSNSLVDGKAIQLDKLDATGNRMWSRTLPESVYLNRRGIGRVCSHQLSTLPDDDLLVSCFLPKRLALFRLESKSGKVTRYSIIHPACDPDEPQKNPINGEVFMSAREDWSVIISASYYYGERGDGCLWLGKVNLSKN